MTAPTIRAMMPAEGPCGDELDKEVLVGAIAMIVSLGIVGSNVDVRLAAC